MCAGALALAVAGACIIPDKDIAIIVDECGKEWVASTSGAVGYNGLENEVNIKTEEGNWVAKRYCATEEQDALLANPNSWLYDEVRDDIIAMCEARAIELTLGDPTCDQVVTISYVGNCPLSSGECLGDTGGDEADGGAETGGSELKLGDLDLTQEVSIVRSTCVVSAMLIETIIADPVGVSNDGTTATQVFDVTGVAYGFEVNGVTSTNLGGVLGFQNGDVVTKVSGQATHTYSDLFDVTAILLSANSASVEVDRGGGTVTLYYERGS